MAIRNLEAYVAALWNWDFLNESCFKELRDGVAKDTGIRVSDVDGAVERNGWLLLIEAKSPGKPIPRGQEMMFDRLSAQGVAVIVLWGEPNNTEFMQIWFPHKPKGPRVAADNDQVRLAVRDWFRWANFNAGQPRRT